MILPSDIHQALIGNTLDSLSEYELFRLVKVTLDELPQFVIDGDEYKLIDRLKGLNSSAESSDIIHMLFGNFIDLSILEKQRILQVSEEPQIDFSKIKKVVNPNSWLSGGLSCDFEYENGNVVSLLLNYPFHESDIKATRINGALYLDGKLVPVRSELERNIVSVLKGRKWCISSSVNMKIINFIESTAYSDYAIKIGRIKQEGKK